MTRTATALIAIAGVTPAVLSQTPTLRFTADTTDPTSFGTVNWTVSLTGVSSLAFVHAYDLDIIANVAVGNAGFSNTTPFATAMLPILQTPGTPSNGSILGASGGQSTLLDPLGVQFGDVVLGTFSVTSAGPQLGLTYDIDDGGVLDGVPMIRVRTTGDLGPVIFEGRPNVVSDTVNFTPAPSTAPLLAITALAHRRRRTHETS